MTRPLRVLTRAAAVIGLTAAAVLASATLVRIGVDRTIGPQPVPLELPAILGPAHIHLSPDGNHLAVSEPGFERLRLFAISLVRDRADLIERANIPGPISGALWEDDVLLVRVSSGSQLEDVFRVTTDGRSLRVAADVPKGSPVALLRGSDSAAVLIECCPAELRLYERGTFNVLAQEPSLVSLLGWNANAELVYAVAGELRFWSRAGTDAEPFREGADGVGILTWSADRSAAVLGTGTRTPSYHVLVGHRTLPMRVAGATPTGRWQGHDPILIAGATVQVFDAATSTPRPIATLGGTPRVVWGASERYVFWSGAIASELRTLDLASGSERVHNFNAPLVAVLVCESTRYVVLEDGSSPLLVSAP
jgi:hypothetical protein